MRCSLLDSVSSKIPQILINRETLSNHVFDTELLGDCDEVLREICSRLGWDVDASKESPKEQVWLTIYLDRLEKLI